VLVAVVELVFLGLTENSRCRDWREVSWYQLTERGSARVVTINFLHHVLYFSGFNPETPDL
jgi:hypothetical protein